jgi:hypothetical protein
MRARPCTLTYEMGELGRKVFRFKSEEEALAFQSSNPPDATVEFAYFEVGGVRHSARNRSFSREAYHKALANRHWEEGYFQRTGRKWEDDHKRHTSEHSQETNSEEKNLNHDACLRLLGLNAKFSEEGLKKAYREAIKMNHPDKVAGLAVEFKMLAEKRTRLINLAYSKLVETVS